MRSAIAFDVDNTLTAPRESLTREMARRLQSLAVPFALAAGSDLLLLMTQFFEPLQQYGFRGSFDAFVCNGASRYRCRSGSRLHLDSVEQFSLREHLGENFDRLWALLARLASSAEYALPNDFEIIGSVLVDRQAMVNFSPIGRPEGHLSEAAMRSRQQFVRFDEQTGYRERLMPALRAAVAERIPGNDLRITLGGQTSFDLVVKGRDKSYAVRSLLDEGSEKVIYVGAALFPGGNDAAVTNFAESWPAGHACPVEVVRVNGWRPTAELIDSGVLLQQATGFVEKIR